LDIPEKPGAPTLRKQLEQVEKTCGVRDKLLDSVKVPEGFEYLWTLFWEIRAGSSEGMTGVKITWRDLTDWQLISGIELDAFELQAIMAMDGVVATHLGERQDG